jgi:hypothetical protein
MNLSRFTTLLVILSIRLFFVTERVTRQGYYDASFFVVDIAGGRIRAPGAAWPGGQTLVR